MATLAAAVENCCGLISRADLDLNEVGALASAVAHVGTLHRGCMCIPEGVCSSKYVVYFSPFQVHLVLKLGLNSVNVGTCSAEEAEVVK